MVEEIRIGVFVCHCGSNIAGVINIPELIEHIKNLENVVMVDDGKWSCSSDYLEKMCRLIKSNSLNRVVIASCSPRTHESLFKQAIGKSGLNPYLLEFVSIREQVSWVHMNTPDEATHKAKELIAMGVSKAFFLKKGYEIKIPVGRSSLIIGGGIAGINAALNMANQGFKVFLVEKELNLGGVLNNVKFMINDNKKVQTNNIIKDLLEKIRDSKIIVYSNSKIESLSGYIGNYTIKLTFTSSNSKKLKADTIIVATGIEEIHPNDFYTFRKMKIFSQLDLEKMFLKGILHSAKKIGIINCVNSKNKIRGCCNIGCHISIKNAVELKMINENNDVVIIYRDLSLYKQSGHLYYKAKKLGITFVRFSNNNYPKIRTNRSKIVVRVFDVLLSNSLRFEFDLLISTLSFKGGKYSNKIRNFLKVSADNDYFFQENHVKLNPLEFSSKGIGLCGSAKYPMFFEESATEGIGAAIKVSIPMINGYMKSDGIVANINISQCKKCGLCIKNCPYNAILFSTDGYPKILKALCQGCGLCAADCISKSISILNYSDDQIFAQIEKALESNSHEKIIGFICHWCALGGVDMAGVGRLQYSPSVLLVRVMCSARISYSMLEKCFSLGAAGSLVVGCEFPTCHYIVGNYAAKKRINKAKKKLKKLGYDSEKLWIDWCSAADGSKFANIINNMATFLKL